MSYLVNETYVTKWEYLVVQNEGRRYEIPNSDYTVNQMNRLGAQGWEFVCADDIGWLYFKRKES